MNYIEKVKLFGYNGKIYYHCKNPHEDDFPDFIGKVEYLMLRITDELSEEQANNLSKLIIEYTGKENLEDKNEYLPICINYDLESPHWIKCEINNILKFSVKMIEKFLMKFALWAIEIRILRMKC